MKRQELSFSNCELERNTSHQLGSQYIHIALGEYEQAFAALETAYAAHDQQLIWLGGEVTYDPIRSDPRFADLMRRVGLSPGG